MATSKGTSRPALRVGDAAVSKRTGKTWDQWLSVLDAAGASAMSHSEIVAILREQGVGAWWRQMVTVGYEQARGLRAKHERADGYSVSVTRTMAVPLPMLYQAWTDAQLRKRWLVSEPFTIRRATRDRSLRITWKDATTVVVAFFAKGSLKSLVAVQHDKLNSAAAAARTKAMWAAQLARLKAHFELKADRDRDVPRARRALTASVPRVGRRRSGARSGRPSRT